MTDKLPVTPVPKPRQTRADKWKKRPAVLRYRAFADEIRLRLPLDYEMNHASITFTLPMPKSWSKKKKDALRGQPHQQKPDIDNLAKALLDALYGDDSHIHTLSLHKRWGDEGSILIKKRPEIPPA